MAEPNTVTTLAADFRRLGVSEGMTLLVHSSLRSIGWVCGGAVAVVLALEQVLTETGTLVMPAHSSDLTDPAHWIAPPVPESWWQVIRDEMPAFDRRLTPTNGMGRIPETFRNQEGVLRSGHPNASFAAWGKDKEYILQDAHYNFSQNEESPLGRIYEKDGAVLLLGVGYDKNTSFHLAEYKAKYPSKMVVRDGFPIMRDGVRKWECFDDILYNSDDFPTIGEGLEETGLVCHGKVGAAETRLIPQRGMVDFAVVWMEENRR
jgi:aminoglycoside 3-N-acetyltransferase